MDQRQYMRISQPYGDQITPPDSSSIDSDISCEYGSWTSSRDTEDSPATNPSDEPPTSSESRSSDSPDNESMTATENFSGDSAKQPVSGGADGPQLGEYATNLGSGSTFNSSTLPDLGSERPPVDLRKLLGIDRIPDRGYIPNPVAPDEIAPETYAGIHRDSAPSTPDQYLV